MLRWAVVSLESSRFDHVLHLAWNNISHDFCWDMDKQIAQDLQFYHGHVKINDLYLGLASNQCHAIWLPCSFNCKSYARWEKFRPPFLAMKRFTTRLPLSKGINTLSIALIVSASFWVMSKNTSSKLLFISGSLSVYQHRLQEVIIVSLFYVAEVPCN